MTEYQLQESIGGKWAKAAELHSGITATIVSEAKSQPSSFKDKDGNPKTQDVAKVRFDGQDEPLNVSLNRATINGLIKAFGSDSKGWMNKPLVVETEKVRVAGKAVVALYLVPSGFAKVDDENGYAMIVRAGEEAQRMSAQALAQGAEEGINPEDIPF